MEAQSNYNDAQGLSSAENLCSTTGSSSSNANSGNRGQIGDQNTGLNENFNSGRVEPGAPTYLGAVDSSFENSNNQSSNFNTQDLNRGQGTNLNNSAFSSSNDNKNTYSSPSTFPNTNSGNLTSNARTGTGTGNTTYDYLGSGPAIGSGGIFQGSETTSDLTSSSNNKEGNFETSRSCQADSIGSGANTTGYSADQIHAFRGAFSSGINRGATDSTGNFSSVSDNNNLIGQRSNDQYQAQQSQQQQSSQSQSQTNRDGFGGSNLQSAPKTGNATIDNAVGQLGNKLDQQTDKDGFTNLTGDKSAPGILTGRVKNDANSSEPPIIETTSSRSERDSEGRELDSYGKPYEL